jgi:hypothetical protein
LKRTKVESVFGCAFDGALFIFLLSCYRQKTAMMMPFIQNKDACDTTLGYTKLSEADQKADDAMVVSNLKRFKEHGRLKQNALMAVSFEPVTLETLARAVR